MALAKVFIVFLLSTQILVADDCPTPKLCSDIYNSKEACEKKNKKQCDAFLEALKESFKQDQCKKGPTLWLCAGFDEYLDYLSKMKSKKAQYIYASPEFRMVLDGAVAETHLKKSKALAKKLHL